MSANNSSIDFDGNLRYSATMAPTMAPTIESTVVPTMAPRMRFGAANSRAASSSFVLQLDVPLVFLGITLMLVFKMWLDSKYVADPANDNVLSWRMWRDRDRNNTNTNDIDDSGNNDGNNDSGGIRNLLIEDWVYLYNKTFDSNGNQLVLTSEHIVGIDSTMNNQLSDTDEISSTSTIAHSSTSEDDFVDVESGEEKNQIIEEDDTTKTHLCLDYKRNDNSKSFLSRSMSCKAVDSDIDGEKHHVSVGGSCVICLEEFEEGDEIVWSSSSSSTIVATGEESADNACCQHVFHKECMVQYLACKSHRRFRKFTEDSAPTGLDIETPCPICRRRFCTISDEDLAVAIKSRCLEGEAVDIETPGSSPPLIEEDHDASPGLEGEAVDIETEGSSPPLIEEDHDASPGLEGEAVDIETPGSSSPIIEEDHDASPTTD